MEKKSDFLKIKAVRNGYIVQNSVCTYVHKDEQSVGMEIGNSFNNILKGMHENETIKVEFNVYGTEDEN